MVQNFGQDWPYIPGSVSSARQCMTYDKHIGFIRMAIWGWPIQPGGPVTTVTGFLYPLLSLDTTFLSSCPFMPPRTTSCLDAQLTQDHRASHSGILPKFLKAHNDFFFFLLLFIFNWRVITLQYCVGFCHTSTWISHRYTCVPFLLNLLPTSHPSRLSQNTGLSNLSQLFYA